MHSPAPRPRPRRAALVACALLTAAACTPASAPTPPAPPTPTPFVPAPPTPTLAEITIWADEALPARLRDALQSLPAGGGPRLRWVDDSSAATVRVEAGPDLPLSTWIYAVVAPFPTVPDAIESEALRAAWAGADGVLVAPATAAALTSLLGPPGDGGARVAPAASLLDLAWDTRPALAVVPFEELAPRWKVLEIAGQSPLRRDFDATAYPLAVRFGLSGDRAAASLLAERIRRAEAWPESNRDPARLTVLLMTGVTAMARGTAYQMDRLGVTYPGALIADWAQGADLVHISNEAPFYRNCPDAAQALYTSRFCSPPHYIELFEWLGVDLIELTGNHLLDFGRQPLLETLELYRAHGYQTFGGGANLDEALRPALIEHNGNRLAFLGANPAGPTQVWATETSPGSAPWDKERLYGAMAELRAQGYLPVFTFQWTESYSSAPMPGQRTGFREAADAGAVIVSGSQAHQPQAFEFYQDSFIHYGLGNLFFAQMWSLPTRQAFLDRHVFYDGRHISTELLTTVLEDHVQPRPMTAAERATFLAELFAASGW